MDPSDFPVNNSPRRELQGPRPTPLRVRKDSYKIRKPPLAPHPSHPQQAPPRQPVIIYTVSPKIIHTSPSDFMNLVQRLTGASSSSTASSSPGLSTASHPFNDNSGAISPAARYATIEKANNSPEGKKQADENIGFVEGIEMGPGVERTSLFPGILSPGPTSLPPISPNFFSPGFDPNSISFLHDLSPVVHGNKNFIEGSFMPSPSNFIYSYPSPSIDLFNNLFDL
ncbi:hypothetical protein SLE2022_329980 [Rubroshorea leprosula]